MTEAGEDGERLDEAVACLELTLDSLEDDDSAAESRAVVLLRLGAMHGLRFLCFSGGQEDADSAVASLSELLDHDGVDADITGHCHALLAQLELGRLLPAELRRGKPADFQKIDVDTMGPHVAEHAKNALRHLNSMPDSVMSAPETAAALAVSKAVVAAAGSDVDLATVDAVLGHLDQATRFAPDEGGVELAVLRAGLGAFRADRYGSVEQADAAALTDRGVTALVYLLPADDYGPGTALIVGADGQVRAEHLPKLRIGGAVEEFEAPAADLRRALGALCDWAWQAAMAGVLDAVGPQPRLILVPVGRLAVVPWHAARRVVAGGGLRYACQDAVLSYAASARQFVRASQRTVRSWASAPALVRVGASALYWASREIEHIRARFYPDATYFGGRRRGGGPPATPDNVLTVLPSKESAGASLLHLGVHAHLATPPVDTYLALDGPSRLTVRDMLEQARHRAPDSDSVDGGLVVLGACASDHSGREHDEALTLATAFLAAGAVGVVGARWGVEDIPTAIFMIMFHHYLNSGYDDPATALRAAQVWMLNEDRRVPAGVDPLLVAELRRLDLTVIDRWVAFTYQGR